MLKIRQKKFLFFGVVIIGVFLLGIPTLYAGDKTDDSTVPEWVGSADEAVDSNEAVEEGTEDLGDLSEDLVYTPVTPCVIVDTRVGYGFLPAGGTQYYRVDGSLGAQGGEYCPSPVGTPSAAHLQVTVANPNGKGNLMVFPADASGSRGLTINYNNIGTNLANAGTVKVRYSSSLTQIGVRNNYAGSHVVIQVLGYYSRPEATQLQVIQYSASKSVSPGSLFYVYSPTCPTDYVATGGGCTTQYHNDKEDIMSFRPYPTTGTPTAWECRGHNNEAFTQEFTSHVICTRIRGR